MSKSDLIRSVIEKHLVPRERSFFGMANLSGLLPDPDTGDHPSGISIALRLNDAIVDRITEGPTPEYYEHYQSVNRELSGIASAICRELVEQGISCHSVAPTVYISTGEFRRKYPTLTHSVSHKMIATRAGLGWIGKTDLFISKDFGARLRLASILVDAPPEEVVNTIDRSLCGKCMICVEWCPAKAASGRPWDIHTHRDLFFDAHKCLEQCEKFARTRLNRDVLICGICVAVCPMGKKQ